MKTRNWVLTIVALLILRDGDRIFVPVELG